MFRAGAGRALGGLRGAGRGATGAPAAAGAVPELPAFDHRPSFAGAPREEVLTAGRRHLSPAKPAKELAAKLPGDLSVVYFVNSGSEANDLAHMMARLYTGNHDIVALRNLNVEKLLP